VLLTIEDYERLTRRPLSLAEALAQPTDFAFKPARLGEGVFRPTDFD